MSMSVQAAVNQLAPVLKQTIEDFNDHDLIFSTNDNINLPPMETKWIEIYPPPRSNCEQYIIYTLA